MMTNQFRGSTALYAGLLTLAVTAVLAMPAHAQRQSAQNQRKQKTAEIPTCDNAANATPWPFWRAGLPNVKSSLGANIGPRQETAGCPFR